MNKVAKTITSNDVNSVQLKLLHCNVPDIVTFSEGQTMHWLHCALPHCAFLTFSKADGWNFYVWERHTGACLWSTVNRGFENSREKSTEPKVSNIIARSFFALFFCVVKVATPSVLDHFNSYKSYDIISSHEKIVYESTKYRRKSDYKFNSEHGQFSNQVLYWISILY